jgi:LPS-assembly protein
VTRRGFTSRLGLTKALLLAVFFHSSFAFSAATGSPLQFRADEYETNLKTKMIEARGSVSVQFDEFDVSGDELKYNPATGGLEVIGNFILKHPKYSASGRKVEYNLKTKQGTFFNSRLKHSRGIILEAIEVSALGEDRFKIYQGKLTTCEDCPPAWSFAGGYIDLTIEGYAEIHHALLQIKDVPLLYFPVFVLPIKTKRQSGFLFPTYAYSSHLGPQLAQAYYYAPRADFDDTIEYRYFTRAGSRFANELRYRHSQQEFR